MKLLSAFTLDRKQKVRNWNQAALTIVPFIIFVAY